MLVWRTGSPSGVDAVGPVSPFSRIDSTDVVMAPIASSACRRPPRRGAVGPREPQDAEARSEALLGMGLRS